MLSQPPNRRSQPVLHPRRQPAQHRRILRKPTQPSDLDRVTGNAQRTRLRNLPQRCTQRAPCARKGEPQRHHRRPDHPPPCTPLNIPGRHGMKLIQSGPMLQPGTNHSETHRRKPPRSICTREQRSQSLNTRFTGHPHPAEMHPPHTPARAEPRCPRLIQERENRPPVRDPYRPAGPDVAGR